MIVSTFNIRGLEGRLKRNKIRSLVSSHNIDFIAIQETKLEVVSVGLCRSLWGDDDFDWVFWPSQGNSGGILSLWRKFSGNALSPDSYTACVLCGCQEETATHLFLHCSVAARVWNKVATWLDFSFITPPNLFIHFCVGRVKLQA